MPTDHNPNILDQDQLASLMGYERAGDVERRLVQQGIRPIYGRPGHFFITVDQLNAVRGIFKHDSLQEEPII